MQASIEKESMKLTGTGTHAVRIALAAVASLLAACASSGSPAASSSATAAVSPLPPPTGIVERTTFDPSLNVHLDSMARRASGLYVKDLRMGTGSVALRGKSVVVRYIGWLPSGKQFDQGEITVTLGSNKTIPAWEEGLLGMRVGGVRQLVVPPNLGYGEKGAGADIPPNSVLVFEMQVMSSF
jgi:peptidylprolyl isomerase